MPRWLSLVERVIRNLDVVGSIPTRGSAFFNELEGFKWFLNQIKPIHKKIVNDPLFKEYVKYRNLKPETIRSYY